MAAMTEVATRPSTVLSGRPVRTGSIPPGGITPDELRNAHLREAFRGYHRDHVDALCERAAETIEHLDGRVEDLEDRLRRVLDLRGGSERGAPEPARPNGNGTRPEVGPRDTARDVDVVQRTLALAQQAADEAVAEAQVRAHRLVGDAQATAAALMSEAESTARRVAEEERTRVAAEVVQLESRRRGLQAEVEMLEGYAEEYRDRLRRAVGSELARLDGSAVAAVTAPVRPFRFAPETLVPEAALTAAPVPDPAPALDPARPPTPEAGIDPDRPEPDLPAAEVAAGPEADVASGPAAGPGSG